MQPAVEKAISELRKNFHDAQVLVEEDGAGGAYVIVEPVTLGSRYTPQSSWIGGHIPPQSPYADVYPLFIGADVRRADGAAFVAPISNGHNFRGRPALQVSRRTNRLDPAVQTADKKFQKVLHWLQQTT